MSLSFSDAAKAKKLREYFARHGRVYIVVNATLEEVDVPEQFRGDPALRLILNSRMPQPIFIHDDMLQSDFSFSGHSYPCRIPMHAIWASYLPDGDLEQGIIWDDCVPEMIQSLVKAVRSNIKAVEDTPAGDASAAEKLAGMPQPATANKSSVPATEEKQPAGEGRKVGHLRVIK
ncbi:MAG TPA: hypothetical protein VKA31_05425 [Mariprofundaceae bacterium]|nr:hypothetical protein [Mariprofundaceae bacterium]